MSNLLIGLTLEGMIYFHDQVTYMVRWNLLIWYISSSGNSDRVLYYLSYSGNKNIIESPAGSYMYYTYSVQLS